MGVSEARRDDDLSTAAGFTRWVEPHWVAMSRLAERLTNGVDHEDVLQDALALAWRKRRQYDPERGSARNWLLALTADQARKSWRHAGRRPAALVEEPAGTIDARIEGDRVDVERALTMLTARQKLAIDLYYYLGLSIADLAEVMGCAEGTAKSTLADARRRLRTELGEGFR